MADSSNLVTIVVAFHDEARFLGEAVASVRAQTYSDWELLLCDDGSSDGSSEMAKELAASAPERVRYLHHPGHENRGASATRNLGVSAARGDWIAFLDGDDIWLPNRLARSVALACAHPEADMVYGRTEYWYSWADAATESDRVQPHFFRANRLVRPPELLVRHLTLRAALPCMGSLLVRRDAFLAVGGFESSFRGLVDDAVFLAKFCLHHPVYVSNECWDRYRQHPASDTAIAEAQGRMSEAQQSYLGWLEAYIERQSLRDGRVLAAVHSAQRRLSRSPWSWRGRLERLVRRTAWALHR